MRRATTARTVDVRLAAVALGVAAGLGVAAPARAQPACPPPTAATNWPAPLDRVVTPGADAQRISLRVALERLATATGVRLSYSRELLPADHTSCLGDDPLPLGAALARLLGGTGITAIAVANDQVVLAPAPTTTGTPAVPVLQQVVVTGSASAAPARRLPFALNIVDRDALGSTNTPLTSLLNGRVPGMWAWSQPPTSLLARYGSLRGASSFSVSAPKFYLDGVELANPLVVTELPPERIERVEIIRGPQGAALYGADAISGVVNVVTRHDGADPNAGSPTRTIMVRTGVGAAGSAFASRPALAQDHAILLRAGDGPQTAGLSFAASTLGPYLPGATARRLTATGDLRRVTQSGTFTATARLADAAASAPANPLLTAALAASASGDSTFRDPGVPGQRLRQLTVSATGSRAAGQWTHSLTAGIDAYRLTGVASDIAPLPAALDSAQRAANGSAARLTLRASSSATVDLTPRVRATVTGIADYGYLRDATADGDTLAGKFMPSDGPVPGGPMRSLWRTAQSPDDPTTYVRTGEVVGLGTAGLVGQVTVALDDALFVTAGLRGERNDGFTQASRFAALPTVGISAVRPLGPGAGAGGATLKLRAAYGSGLRPARSATRSAAWRGIGRLDADLAPESQRGLETGLDFLAGGGRTGAPTLTASVTRFDQRASNLLQQVGIAPRLSSGAPPPQTWHRPGPHDIGYEVENVGEIDNRGWELETALQSGPLAVGATLAFVDSRVHRTARGYTGDLRAGDRMLQVPRRTAGAFATWRAGPWSASTQVSRASDWINYDRLALASSSLDTSQLVGERLRQFWRRYAGVTHLGAGVGRDVARGFTVVITGSNLLDRQQGEPDNATVLPGRTVTAGVRATF